MNQSPPTLNEEDEAEIFKGIQVRMVEMADSINACYLASDQTKKVEDSFNAVLVTCNARAKELTDAKKELQASNGIPTNATKELLYASIDAVCETIDNVEVQGARLIEESKNFRKKFTAVGSQFLKVQSQVMQDVKYATSFNLFVDGYEAICGNDNSVLNNDTFKALRLYLRKKYPAFSKECNKCIWCLCCWKIITFKYTNRIIPKFDGTEIPKGIPLSTPSREMKRIVRLLIQVRPPGSSTQILNVLSKCKPPRIAFRLTSKSPNHLCFPIVDKHKLSVESTSVIPAIKPSLVVAEDVHAERKELRAIHAESEIKGGVVSKSQVKAPIENNNSVNKSSVDHGSINVGDVNMNASLGKRLPLPLRILHSEAIDEGKVIVHTYISERRDSKYDFKQVGDIITIKETIEQEIKDDDDVVSENKSGESSDDDDDNKKDDNDHPEGNQKSNSNGTNTALKRETEIKPSISLLSTKPGTPTRRSTRNESQ